MSAPTLEALLARLYTDEALRRAFLEDPHRVAREAGLDEGEAKRLAAIDREGLRLAASSFGHKRASRGAKRR